MNINQQKHTTENHPWEWFLNFAGIGMAHNYYVQHIFSKVMDENPQIKLIVELGTFKGSMTAALGLEGIRKQIPVWSYEIKDQTNEETKRILATLNVQTRLLDIFEHRDVILKLISEVPTYLICDNGNKADEFALFGNALLPGSIISVHDWNTEFHPHHVSPLEGKIEPFYEEDWMKHNCQLATWKIK